MPDHLLDALNKCRKIASQSESIPRQDEKQWHMEGKNNIPRRTAEFYRMPDDNQQDCQPFRHINPGNPLRIKAKDVCLSVCLSV